MRVSVLRGGDAVVGLLLVLCVWLSSPAASSGAGVHLDAPPPVTLTVITTTVGEAFVSRIVRLYSLVRSASEVDVRTQAYPATATDSSVTNGINAMASGEGDLCLIPAVEDDATLSVARIFQGLLTSWNDPSIAATNPGEVLPNKPIEVVLIQEAQSFINTFIQNMRLIDPLNFTVAQGTGAATPPWPLSNYAKYKLVPEVKDAASYVLGHPYSISLSYSNLADALDVPIVNLINDYGNVVAPTYVAASMAFSERAVASSRNAQGQIVQSQPLDMLRPPGPNSWPWLQITSLWIPKTYSRGSCVARSEALKFIRFMLHSTMVTDTLAVLGGVVMINDEINKQLRVEHTLVNDLRCNLNPINAGIETAVLSGGAPGATMRTNTRSVLMDAYSIAQKESYSFQYQDEAAALSGTIDVLGQPDVTWLYTNTFPDLYPGVLENYMSSGQLMLVHTMLYGVVPIFHAPADMISVLRPSLPLSLDFETLALIFLGEISSWLDPRLQEWAPDLGTAFAGSATTDITVVLCGQGVMADASLTAISNHFMQAISRTVAFHTLGFNYSLPADWRASTARMDANGVRYVLVQHEIDMEPAVRHIPGAIGYMLAAGNDADIEFELQVSMPIALDPDQPEVLTHVPIAATPTNFLNCAAAQPPTSNGKLIAHTEQRTEVAWKQCWPIVMLLSLGVAADVKTVSTDAYGNQHASANIADLCKRQSKIVKFVQYWAVMPQVRQPLRLAGRVAVSELPDWDEEIHKELRSLNCGGQPILWTRPIVWQLSSAVSTFAVAIALVGLILATVAAVLVVGFRKRTIIYSGNLIRQLVTLGGLMMLFVTPVLFTMTPAHDTCDALTWMLILGATLTFGPICARLRRVYVAHKRRKSMRRSGRELLRFWAPLVVVILLDVIVLSIAQAGGGILRPWMTVVMEDAVEHDYTLCSLTPDYLPHAAVLAGVHIGALLWTSLMAFQVRHITTAYKESANMSWAVWNAVLSTLLIVPLIVLTGGLQGDAGVFLLIFLVSWLALCTLGFDFGYKLWLLLSEEIAIARERMSRSSRSGRLTQSGKLTTGSHTTGSGTGSGTNALSILSLPLLDGVTSISLIEKYIMALERQIAQAKDLRTSKFGAPASKPVPSAATVAVSRDDPHSHPMRHRTMRPRTDSASEKTCPSEAPAAAVLPMKFRLSGAPSTSNLSAVGVAIELTPLSAARALSDSATAMSTAADPDPSPSPLSPTHLRAPTGGVRAFKLYAPAPPTRTPLRINTGRSPSLSSQYSPHMTAATHKGEQ